MAELADDDDWVLLDDPSCCPATEPAAASTRTTASSSSTPRGFQHDNTRGLLYVSGLSLHLSPASLWPACYTSVQLLASTLSPRSLSSSASSLLPPSARRRALSDDESSSSHSGQPASRAATPRSPPPKSAQNARVVVSARTFCVLPPSPGGLSRSMSPPPSSSSISVPSSSFSSSSSSSSSSMSSSRSPRLSPSSFVPSSISHLSLHDSGERQNSNKNNSNSPRCHCPQNQNAPKTTTSTSTASFCFVLDQQALDRAQLRLCVYAEAEERSKLRRVFSSHSARAPQLLASGLLDLRSTLDCEGLCITQHAQLSCGVDGVDSRRGAAGGGVVYAAAVRLRLCYRGMWPPPELGARERDRYGVPVPPESAATLISAPFQQWYAEQAAHLPECAARLAKRLEWRTHAAPHPLTANRRTHTSATTGTVTSSVSASAASSAASSPSAASSAASSPSAASSVSSASAASLVSASLVSASSLFVSTAVSPSCSSSTHALSREQLCEAAAEGFPTEYRGWMWCLLSGANDAKCSVEEDFYHKLVERSRRPGALGTVVKTQIHKDLQRTLPGHAVFASEAGLTDLQNVLSALALHHPEIGYCQSLNFVAGFLLLFTTPENSFWLLSQLVSHILPNYFDRHMIGAPLDQKVLISLVRAHLPKVWNVLQQFEVQLEVITLPWFLCLFATRLPTETMLRMLDLFFARGVYAIFAMALGLLSAVQPALLKCTNGDAVYEILRLAPLQAINPEKVLSSGCNILERSKRGLDVYRQQITLQHDEESKRRDIEELLCRTTFSKSELEALHRQFHNLVSADSDSPAVISLQCTKGLKLAQFTELMHSIYTSPIDICPKLFNVFDVRRSGRVSFRELICGLFVLARGDPEQKFEIAFQIFDIDNSGSLERADLALLLSLMLEMHRSLWKGEGTLLLSPPTSPPRAKRGSEEDPTKEGRSDNDDEGADQKDEVSMRLAEELDFEVVPESDGSLAWVEALLRRCDKEREGYLTLAEFKEALTDSAFQPLRQFLQQLCTSFGYQSTLE